tara:strand:+ start:1173 stop:2099 length:927 start_codon:yes stop_codon:yes gene_type:complete
MATKLKSITNKMLTTTPKITMSAGGTFGKGTASLSPNYDGNTDLKITGENRFPNLKGPTKGGSFPFPFGGGGGGGDMGRLAQEEFDRQIALMDKAAEMGAGYSSDNTLGTTDIDYENKMITERLSPELQAHYDRLLARSGASQDRVDQMGSNPYEMQQYLYDANMELKRPEQDALRDDTMSMLAAKGMLGSTGGSAQYSGVEESIARSNAMDFNDALMQSQGLLDMERARGSGDLSTAMAMGGAQIPYITAGTNQGRAIPIENVAGVSGASRNIFGVAAGEYAGNQKRKKGIWDSLLGDGGFLGGLLG